MGTPGTGRVGRTRTDEEGEISATAGDPPPTDDGVPAIDPPMPDDGVEALVVGGAGAGRSGWRRLVGLDDGPCPADGVARAIASVGVSI